MTIYCFVTIEFKFKNQKVDLAGHKFRLCIYTYTQSKYCHVNTFK